MTRPSPVRVMLALAGLGVAACGSRSGGGGGALQLVDIWPAVGATPIQLNDDVRLVFSEVIDPTSITKDAVRLEHAVTGRAAKGDWTIDGRELRFRPNGPLRAALDDGGFRPGAQYRITVAGFPSLGGPRSSSGRGLPRSFVHTFRAVANGAVDSGGKEVLLLRDLSPDRASRLRLRPGDDGAGAGTPLEWDRDLILACDEPIDPRGLRPEDFEVRVKSGASSTLDPIGRAEEDAVAVAAFELVRNDDEDVRDPRVAAAALLRVTLASGLPVPDGSMARFELALRAGVRGDGGLRDFSGASIYPGPIPFFAARRDDFVSERSDSYEIEFLDARDFVPLLDPSSDGTAHWTDTGRLEVRYPAAAGSGADRAVELVGDWSQKDVHATRLHVPEGRDVELTGDGLVVLRSQGRVDINGRLLRKLAKGVEFPPMWNPVSLDDGRDNETLSNWLQRAEEGDAPWTVIIAGGDLVVTGSLSVETPLLLVAGGRIRGAGEPGAAPNQVWLLGEGGFASMPHQRNPSASARVKPPLVVDPPLYNPLVEPLTFVAISSAVPKVVAPSAWGTPRVLGHGGAGGEYVVQYLDDEGSTAAWEDWLGQAVPYDEPMDLVRARSRAQSGGSGAAGDGPVGTRVRLRVELRLAPSVNRRNPGPFDPPFVDSVRLLWTPNPR